MVRSGAGLMFLILTLFFGLTVASIILAPIEQPEAAESLVAMAKTPVEWILLGSAGEDLSPAVEAERERWSSYLLDDRPAVLSTIFVILLFGLPFLVPFGAFNQTAGEIGNRGLRYLLLRTERANIFFGRMLATVLFTVLVLGLTLATISFYVGLRLELYPAADVFGWSLYGLCVLSVLALPYISLCAWVSASSESAMVSLVICELIIGGVLLIALWGGAHNEYAGWCKYVLPWGLQNRLFAPDVEQVLLAVGACLGYAAIFTALGYRKFTRRDL
jgi:ABC-type transport system involved in multi-copper enzyme maturation permease subunit